MSQRGVGGKKGTASAPILIIVGTFSEKPTKISDFLMNYTELVASHPLPAPFLPRKYATAIQEM